MKKIIALQFLILLLSNLYAQSNELRLIVTRAPYTKANRLLLVYEMAGKEYQDSFILKPGKTIYVKKLLQPAAAIISVNEKSIPKQKLFLSNRIIEIEVNSKTILINTDTLQKEFTALTANDEIRPLYFPLYSELLEKNDTIGLGKISILFDSLKQDDITKAYSFTKKNNQSVLALFAFQRYSSFKADYSIIENDFLTLPLWVRKTPDGKLIAEKIAGVKNGALGNTAVNFSQQSANGRIIEFSKYKGKYILLDFWASWCVPCRKEHPVFHNLYTTYQSKGFEIISVSLDNNKEAWLNAILKDEMTWVNTSDLKGQQNKVAVKYGIQAIPANFLIDPNGIIIAKNLTAEELSVQLNQLIK
jgi:thiol-disulfide isomerase/thioredoxin